MRKMRLAKREIQEKKRLMEILEQAKVLRIGTMDQEGIYIVPVNYGYSWEEGEPLRFYIHSAREGRKVQAFAASGDAGFELDLEQGVIRGTYTCSYSYAYQSITGTGKIRLLEDMEEKKQGLARIMEHMAPEAELCFSPEMLQAVNVYCLEAVSFKGKERKPKAAGEEGNTDGQS